MESDALLAGVGLGKQFSALIVLDDVNFSVRAGEAVGIVGPNGAGKTTLLNLLSGAYRPSAGAVLFRGVDVTHFGAAQRCRLGIARSHQIPRPFGGMTLFENVLSPQPTAPASAATKPMIVASMRSACAACCRTLIVGRKRWACSTASGLNSHGPWRPIPRCLLLDEIGGGLTDSEASELVHTIGELQARGIAIVWIEHIVHVLVQVVERLVCLDGGRVIADAEPNAVLADDNCRPPPISEGASRELVGGRTARRTPMAC